MQFPWSRHCFILYEASGDEGTRKRTDERSADLAETVSDGPDSSSMPTRSGTKAVAVRKAADKPATSNTRGKTIASRARAPKTQQQRTRKTGTRDQNAAQAANDALGRTAADDERDCAYVAESTYHLVCLHRGCAKSIRSQVPVYLYKSDIFTHEGLMILLEHLDKDHLEKLEKIADAAKRQDMRDDLLEAHEQARKRAPAFPKEGGFWKKHRCGRLQTGDKDTHRGLCLTEIPSSQCATPMKWRRTKD